MHFRAHTPRVSLLCGWIWERRGEGKEGGRGMKRGREGEREGEGRESGERGYDSAYKNELPQDKEYYSKFNGFQSYLYL